MVQLSKVLQAADLAGIDDKPRPGAGHPNAIRHTPETKALAVALMDSGMSATETQSCLDVAVTQATIIRWHAEALSSRGASECDAWVTQKRQQLKAQFLSVSEVLAGCSMDMAAAGDGKGAQGAATAAGIMLDKALLLDGKPIPGRLSVHEQRIIHETAGKLPLESPDSVMERLKVARSAAEDPIDATFTAENGPREAVSGR